ncbi:Nn.00g049120.m01.CDS01 [Neocucurbitaria sp. VM-36]
MGNSPRFRFFARAHEDTVTDMMHDLMRDSTQQVTFNYLTDLFTKPLEQVVGPRTVKNLGNRPKFHPTVEHAMERHDDYKNRAGMGALIDHNWKDGKN